MAKAVALLHCAGAPPGERQRLRTHPACGETSMARQPRCAAAGLLHLLELRWCADVTAQLGEAERVLQRRLLAESALRWHVSVHAYALGRTRTLLLLTPSTGEAPARLVQDLCRRLAAHFRQV